MVPAMVYLLKTPQREANGTSLAVIVPVAVVGATILGRGHQVDIQVGVILALGAVGGAVLGARLTRRVSDIGLRRAFGIVAVVAGIVMIGDPVGPAVAGDVHIAGGLHPSGISLCLLALVVGAMAGALSGLLGVVGG